MMKIKRFNDDENQTTIAHCFSADAKMIKGFAITTTNNLNGLQDFFTKRKLLLDQSFLSGITIRIFHLQSCHE